MSSKAVVDICLLSGEIRVHTLSNLDPIHDVWSIDETVKSNENVENLVLRVVLL